MIPCFHEEIKDGLLEEERRLFYMAMTRAKNNLYLLTPKHRYGKKVEVSRFTEEMFLWLRAKQNKDSLARKL